MGRLAPLLMMFAMTAGATAQSITPKGAPATFDVATWNIEFFGSGGGPVDDQKQFDNVLAVIEQADIDLWAIQEINDVSDFNALVAALAPTYDGRVATISSNLRLGFIYKTDVVGPRGGWPKHILTSFSDEFAGRPPFELEANISVGDTTVTIVIVTVHLKAQSDVESYDRRAASATRLKNRIDFTTAASKRVLILGDFNDLVVGSITPGRGTPFSNFVADAANYRFVTEELHTSNRNTFCFNGNCSSGSTIDHLLISNELFADYQPGSVDHYDELLSQIATYVTTTSDHLPVFASFRFATETSSEDPFLESGHEIAAYPNPVSSRLAIEISSQHALGSRVEIVDVLGRVVRTILLSPGESRLTVDTSDLVAGMYFVRVPQAGSGRYHAVVVAR